MIFRELKTDSWWVLIFDACQIHQEPLMLQSTPILNSMIKNDVWNANTHLKIYIQWRMEMYVPGSVCLYLERIYLAEKVIPHFICLLCLHFIIHHILDTRICYSFDYKIINKWDNMQKNIIWEIGLVKKNIVCESLW